MYPSLRILNSGLGPSIQDYGRTGLRKYGIPPSGVMDRESADFANRLLGNLPGTAVLEIPPALIAFECLDTAWVAVAGAATPWHVPFSAKLCTKGEILTIPAPSKGVWTYLALPGGIEECSWMGSLSAYPRAEIGTPLAPGSTLRRINWAENEFPGVAKRLIPEKERPNYASPITLGVWPGPQWKNLPVELQSRFLETEWHTTSKMDRSGYQLEGADLSHDLPEMTSEPLLPGTIQLPRSGIPLVAMRDGPTVGGYPQMGVLADECINRLAQAASGVTVRFKLLTRDFSQQ